MRTAAFIALLFTLVEASATAKPAETTTATAAVLTLGDLVTQALANNPQVAVDRARIEEAEALYSLARAQGLPRVEVLTLFGGPTPEAKTDVRNDLSTTTEASFEGDTNFGDLGVTFQLQGQLTVPLYTFEKIGHGKSAARHLVKAAGHQVKATQADIVVNLTQAYWTYQLLRSFASSLAEGEETLEGVLEKISELLEDDSPQVKVNDELRLKHALATLRARKIQAKNAEPLALQAINLLVGREQHGPLNILEQDLVDHVPEDLPDLERVVALTRRQRPELAALREVVAAQRDFTSFRRVSFLPDIFIGGLINYAWTSNAVNQTNPFLRDPFNRFDFASGVGVRFDLDVFTKLAELEQAEAQAHIRAAQENLATEAAELEVRTIHADIRSRLEQLAELRRATRAARGWLTASALAYDFGTGRADELIDAFLAWASSEAQIETTRFEALLKFSELARATGRLVGARDSQYP